MITPLDPNVALVAMALKDMDLPSAHDVADLFKKNGITGRRGAAHDCPGTRYLEARTRLAPTAAAPAVMLGSWVYVQTVAGVWQQLPIPTALRWFMKEFDGGAFDYLVDPTIPVAGVPVAWFATHPGVLTLMAYGAPAFTGSSPGASTVVNQVS